MSLRKPIAVGSTAHEPPEAVWEVLVEVEFDPTLSVSQIDRIQAKLWKRLTEAIWETVGPYVHGGVGPNIVSLHGRGQDTPVFPMVVGRKRFTCHPDIEEMVEKLCQGTDLARLAYDARGLAYDLDVTIEYHRRPHLDGVRAARMPDPEKVA
jgi:hypothetical protein